MEKEDLVVSGPNIEKTCKRCKWGVLLDPYMMSCTKYHPRKPSNVYFDGADCPKFELAKNLESDE